MAGKKAVRHKSALKAARQALKRQARNRAALSQVKTAVKNLKSALGTQVSATEKQKTLVPLLNQAQKVLMSAAQKKIIKRETASRKIARLSQAVHRAGQAQ